MKQHLLLGTAGHIDHGKTSLVQALTGVDTDRLPEEQQRQITIDIGFAELELGELSLGIVDVPGHERFIKNMLAGATGIELAMLVVAADDSVKPQTREHLDILKYLRLKQGVIALTKCDLAEPDWLDLVEDEVRELTAGTFLESAQLVRVSARTGNGIDQLRDAIAKVAKLVLQQRETNPSAEFRMAVDRAFTVSGFGTVVTGSVASGAVSVGDELELQPQAQPVRVRGLQTHDTPVEQIVRGQRAAINLSGVHYEEISRGQTLTSAGLLRPSRLLTVEFTASDQLSKAVKDRSAVRLHIGTASAPGKLSLLADSAIQPGATTYAQLFLSQEIATTWGQPFVLRSVSPVETLGGGRILDPWAVRIKRFDDAHRQHLDQLASDDPLQRAASAAWLAGTRAWQPAELTTLAGVESSTPTVDQLLAQQTVASLPVGNNETAFLHTEIVAKLWQHVQSALTKEHHNTPLSKYVERSRLARHLQQLSPPMYSALCDHWIAVQQLVSSKQGLALANWSPQLSAAQTALLEEIETAFLIAEFQPQSLEQLAADLQQSVDHIAELIDVAVEAGTIVRISPAIFFHHTIELKARTILTEAMAAGQMLTVSEIRDLLSTTRKVTVPLCEYLDAIAFTRREGDRRRLISPEGSTTNHA